MPQPVTYYIQTPAIDQLVAKYGNFLEKLSRGQKLFLLMELAQDAYDEEGDYGNESAVLEFDMADLTYSLQGDEILGLIEALIVQLRHNSHQVVAEVGAIEPTKKAV